MKKFFLLLTFLAVLLIQIIPQPACAASFTQRVSDLRPKAEKGDLQAQNDLALLYCEEGPRQNYKIAFEWFKRAAQKGFPESMYYLANLYSSGLGVKEDRVEAVGWYRKAAAKGHLESKNRSRRFS